MVISKTGVPARWHASTSALPRGKLILGVVLSDGFVRPEGAPPGYFYTGATRHFGHFPPKKGRGRKD
jgi:hypothetical protein